MDSYPRARKDAVVEYRLDDELLVYDLKRHKAFCLNETAALIWKHCDGRTDLARLAEILGEEHGAPVDESVLWLGLRELSRSKLLEQPLVPPVENGKFSRREAIKRLGISAAMTLPLVLSITAPVAAQTGTCLPPGAMCATDSQCCSNMCMGNNQCS
ncbi:MAG TPA: PqqD family peptide modification chaperone [Blastocatellia bacterium]|nr:PqqD family peptide modification chaperone [Blastocatellia bacterium]